MQKREINAKLAPQPALSPTVSDPIIDRVMAKLRTDLS
jgi:hypothetical protein